MANQTDHAHVDSPVIVDQLIVDKVLAMVVLGLGSFLLGLAPLKMTKWWRDKSFSRSIDDDLHHHHPHPGDAASYSPTVSRLLCFGGGVLLSTTLLHLQPEVREVVSRLQRAGQLPETENLGDLLFCAGFFMVFLVDELAHTVLDWFDASGRRVHGADAAVLRRRSVTMLRRSRSSLNQAESTSLGGRIVDQANEEQKEGEGGEEKKEESPSRRQHGHDHHLSVQFQLNGSEAEKQQQRVGSETMGSDDDHSLRGLFTVLALSFHEVFEGMAIGLEERMDHVWYLFLAVATHKLVIAFCVGLELAWSGTRRFVFIVYVATFAVVTPVGIASGMAITHYGGSAVDSAYGSPGPVAAVLQGLAAGTLLYVVFFEVLARHKQSGWSHLLSIMFGFGVLLALQMLTHHHHHGHEGGQNHGDLGHGHNYGHANQHEHGH